MTDGGHNLRVLHVLATTKRRGAEVFASDLVRALNTDHISQRVAVIRPTSSDVPFEAHVATLGQGGTRESGPRMDPRALRRLRQIAARWRPDIAQAHGGEALKNAMAALIGMDIPVIYRRIGMAPRWLARGPRRRAHGWLMRRSVRVVAVADEVRRETIRIFGVDPSRIVTIPNGVDGGRFATTRGRDETRRSLGIGPDTPVLASFGAISWEKDPLAHIRVTARVLRERDVVHLWVGDGPMRDELESVGRELGLDGRLLLTGSRADVADLLDAADIVLFASRSDGMEGMPAAVIEAGIAGRPVVGFAVAGVPEVIVDGETGLLADPADEDGLAAHVLDLVNDEARRGALGAAARRRCLARFEIGSVAPQYLSLYREVANS
jgi:glycosyltransferase involved in cell wall biosynthesis